jgi:hypothetical protein
MAPGWRRLPPAVVTDVPVLGAMVLAWLTIAVLWAHLAAGLLLVVLIALHLLTRRRLPWRGASPRRRVAYGVFLVAATAMAASGLLRWAGLPPQYVWHGGISYAVLGLVVVHLWSIRRALRARFRAHRRERVALRERNTT